MPGLTEARRLINELHREWFIKSDKVLHRDQFALGMVTGLSTSIELINHIIRSSEKVKEE